MAPILTIFIGGNHEASNYLQELPYGGWVAPNIYYLGYASVVTYKGVRIGGLSGIYKGHDFYKGHFEKPPYDNNSIRSVYHYRQQETFRLQQLADPIDIMMSHDWPNTVCNYGNTGELIRFKPHFRDEIHDNRLGSPPCFEMLQKLQPKYWFSGHLHCKFAAVITHDDGNETKFLALDKCLPNRRFLQIVDIEGNESGPQQLQYDLEWLTILYTTKHLTHVKPFANYMPGPGNETCRWNFRPTDEEKKHVLQRFAGNLTIPNNFERTAPPYDPNRRPPMTQQPKPVKNPQTVDFCNILEIDDPLNLVVILAGGEINLSEYRDVMNTSVSDTSLNDSDRLDDSSSNLNTSNASSGGISNLTRLTLFDTLPAPKNSYSESLNPEEADISLSDDEANDDAAGNGENERDTADSQIEAKIVDEDKLACSDVPLIQDPIDDDTKLESTDASLNSGEKRQNDEDTTISTPPTIKKLKRRNAAIYAETDDWIEI